MGYFLRHVQECPPPTLKRPSQSSFPPGSFRSLLRRPRPRRLLPRRTRRRTTPWRRSAASGGAAGTSSAGPGEKNTTNEILFLLLPGFEDGFHHVASETQIFFSHLIYPVSVASSPVVPSPAVGRGAVAVGRRRRHLHRAVEVEADAVAGHA